MQVNNLTKNNLIVLINKELLTLLTKINKINKYEIIIQQ